MPNDILSGKIEITDVNGATIMTWNAETGQASIGGGWFKKFGPPGHPGELTINDQFGKARVQISSDATITAGCPGQGGVIALHDASHGDFLPPTILLNADNKDIVITTNALAGKHPIGSYDVIRLDGATGDIAAGGNGVNAELVLFPAGVEASRPAADKTKATIRMKAQEDGAASFYLGGHGLDGKITVYDSKGTSQVIIDGKSGDILLGGADCAEEFEIIPDERVGPGVVMVVGPDGRLQLSDQAYDRKVVGVLSGAGSFNPGIVLDRKASGRPRAALAVVGKVYCKGDATLEPIAVGDLLTTSVTPGHAMRASDSQRAFGAVIGKALSALPSGRGLIPVLVALQ